MLQFAPFLVGFLCVLARDECGYCIVLKGRLFITSCVVA